MKKKVDYICTNCNSSEDVVWDAWAYWDAENQEMKVDSSFDHCECSKCGAEWQSIDEVPYNKHEMGTDEEALLEEK